MNSKLSDDMAIAERGVKRTTIVTVISCGCILLLFVSLLFLIETNIITIVMLSISLICLCFCISAYKENIFYLILVCFFGLILTANTNFLLGNFISSRTAGYYISSKHDNKVIVYQDAEKLILMPYNKDSGTLKYSYSIVSYDNIDDIVFCDFEQPLKFE